MERSKLVQLYRTMDKAALRKFKKWLYSPIHNEHEEIQALFEFLWTRASLNERTLKKERVWKHLYGTQTYNDLRLRHLMSFALKVLEEFVSYEQAKKENFWQQRYLVQHYLEANMTQRAQRLTEQLAKKLDQRPQKDERAYLQQYELELLRFELQDGQDRNQATNLTEITAQASLFFMLTTLRHAYTALSHQNLRKANYEIPLLAAVLEEVRQPQYANNLPLMIYYHGYQTLAQPQDPTHYQQVRHYLETNQEQLSLREQRAALLIALNYTIKRLNQGEEEYFRANFELYQKGLETNLLVEQGYLSQFAYKNIVSIGIILQEYDWLEAFIPQYAQQLEPNSQESYQQYSQARLCFARGDFDLAMSLLVHAEYEDLLLSLGAKVMLIKLYYQQAAWDALEALLDSFRVFLHRKKSLSYHKQHYLNLILLLKKRLSLPPYDKTAQKQWQAQVEYLQPLAERAWLLSLT